MRTVSCNPNGVPLEPIEPPMPTVFNGTNLIVFDSWDEYYQWCKDNYPPIEPETSEDQNI